MSPDEVGSRSLAVIEHIRALPEWKIASEVLCYWPFKNEVDIRPLIYELWQRGVRVLLPRCRPGQPGVMDVACVTCEDELAEGMYSIMEPTTVCEVMDVTNDTLAPDLALIPGVAFDHRGFRLGYGGGYYDRLLEGPQLGRAFKIGLCFELLFVKKLPVDDWDRPVNAVCTENQLWQK